MSEVKEKLVVHETRFGNGREVMNDIRKDIDKLKPKAPDWLKLMLAVYGGDSDVWEEAGYELDDDDPCVVAERAVAKAEGRPVRSSG